MLQEFLKYNDENGLFDIKKDKILVSVSGGVDSMVMADLFIKAKANIAIAHCNFHLRGEESDRDARFVTQYAQKQGIQLFIQDFDTFSYMKKEKKSLEMSARDLRYDWFEKILKENNFNYLATAHHIDDSAETFIINLLRGTGIAGLHGILPKSGNIIRPMLFTSRREIMKYANENNINFVEDSSNKDTRYTRNKIRHEIIPVLREITPNFDNIIRRDIERLRQTEQVFRTVIDRVKKEIFVEKDGVICVDIEKIMQLHPTNIFLYEILSDYGFNETNIKDICDTLKEGNYSGKQFFSEKYRLVIDRKHLFITPKKQQTNIQDYKIYEGQTEMKVPINLHAEVLKDLQYISIPKEKNIAMFDYDKLQFPLILRHWKQGDAFFPFGMKGKQKISDFFTDHKYSLLDKERCWLMCSGDDIIWVVGQRIDNRFRITDKTTTIFKIEIED